jgi:TetR/AcrR family transcriptional regulator
MASSNQIDGISENIEERILDSAEKSFAENGFNNTKMIGIADIAGVNHALIHYYFRSKEKLYEKVIERLFILWNESLGVLEFSSEDCAGEIDKYIRRCFEFRCQHVDLFRIYRWDTLEKKDVFKKFIGEFWFVDAVKKNKTISDWQKKGYVKSSFNGLFLMHSIWAVLDRFYMSTDEELRQISGNDGSLEQLQHSVSNQLTEIILHGVLA